MSFLAMPPAAYIASNQLQPIIEPITIESAALSGSSDDFAAISQKWSKVVRVLRNWQEEGDEGGDNEYLAPSNRSIEVAAFLADALARRSVEAPDQVVPTGEGGIAFERFEADVYEVIEIGPDGSCEWKLFDKCKLQDRGLLPCP